MLDGVQSRYKFELCTSLATGIGKIEAEAHGCRLGWMERHRAYLWQNCTTTVQKVTLGMTLRLECSTIVNLWAERGATLCFDLIISQIMRLFHLTFAVQSVTLAYLKRSNDVIRFCPLECIISPRSSMLPIYTVGA
jgi:hypothetical protein